MGVHKPQRRDAAAFQLAAVLDELDLEIGRLQLNPRSRTLLTTGRPHIDKARALCEELGVPAAGPADLELAIKDLQREIGHPDGPANMAARAAEVRQVTHALRAVCIAILAKTSRI
jgi:hypothetical protein